MNKESKEPHPWGVFLNARVKVIFWLINYMAKSDKQISDDLSMDEMQVYLIRTHFEKHPEEK